MKKLFFVAAMFAALTVNAQGVYRFVNENSVAQQNHKEKDPETGKDKTIIDAHGDTIVLAGDKGTDFNDIIPNLKVTLMDGAANWEVMGAASEGEFTAQDSVTYNKGYIQGGTNGMDGHLSHANGTSAHIEFTAELKGKVYVAAKFGKNKKIWAAKVPQNVIDDEELDYANMKEYLMEEYGHEVTGKTAAGADTTYLTAAYPKEDGTGVQADAASTDVFAALPVNVEPGYRYFFWVSGSKIMLSGLNYVVEATAVENVEANVVVRKVIENGQIFIEKNGVRYNALGAVVK